MVKKKTQNEITVTFTMIEWAQLKSLLNELSYLIDSEKDFVHNLTKEV